MDIEPRIFCDPSFLHLKETIGDEAIKYLVALWGFCETGYTNQIKGGARMVESVCGWKGEPGRLFTALTCSADEKPWLKMEAKTNSVRVCTRMVKLDMAHYKWLAAAEQEWQRILNASNTPKMAAQEWDRLYPSGFDLAAAKRRRRRMDL